MVDIKPNRPGGLAKAGKNGMLIEKALAAIEQIDTDNATLVADIAALPAATQADTKLILGRALNILLRNQKRQRQIIQFLMKDL